MEYLPLGDLDKCYNEPLLEFQVATVASQLLEGLAKMHEMGFAHRDSGLKSVLLPWNVDCC